ncbi:hypothetical protein K1719_042979 [Acacia pycnantha]|nr:hypothetical protein K1719_042979 [Acacia pycnantha]
MAEANHQLKLVFLPFISTSHIIPVVGNARIFAIFGVDVTIIATPANAVEFPRRKLLAHALDDAIEKYQPHAKVESDSESFVIPGLPDELKMTSLHVSDSFKTTNMFTHLMQMIKDSERKSFGSLFNSFSALEGVYNEHYKKIMGTKSWGVGPVSDGLIKARIKPREDVPMSKKKKVGLNGSTQKQRTLLFMLGSSVTDTGPSCNWRDCDSLWMEMEYRLEKEYRNWDDFPEEAAVTKEEIIKAIASLMGDGEGKRKS